MRRNECALLVFTPIIPMGYNQDTWKFSKLANTASKLNFSYEKYMRQQLENKTVAPRW